MRLGLIISSVAHTGVLMWAVGLFGFAASRQIPEVKPIPIEIVEADTLTRIKAGQPDAKADEPPKAPKEAKPKPVPERKSAPVARTPAAPKTAAATETVPAPKPAPPKAEPEKAAKDKPAKPRKVAVPSRRPRDIKRLAAEAERARADQDRYSADRIAALLNKVPDGARPEPEAPEPDEDVSERSGPDELRGLDARMSMTELDAFRRQISACWSPKVGNAEARNLAVKLHLRFRRDGTLAKPPQVVSAGDRLSYRIAAEDAVRAVLQCQPYALPADKYPVWREMVLNFDPRAMFGG